MTTKPLIGSLKVNLYAGLPGQTPVEIATIHVPLTVESGGNGVLVASLKDAIDTTSATLRDAFNRPTDAE